MDCSSGGAGNSIKDNLDRRVVINTIGPFWDANEVWLITAGGAMFAAFPNWYATMFSGFYHALFLILVALILRAVGIEFRSKGESSASRATADAFIFFGSLVPAFIWGVAITNLVKGVPIGEDMNFQGGLLTLLNPYALLGGLVAVIIFTLHGAIFLSLRTTDELHSRAHTIARRMWWPAAVVLLIFSFLGRTQTHLFKDTLGLVPGTLPMMAIMSFIAAYAFMSFRLDGWAFAATGSTIVMATVVAFQGLFPRVMPSSIDSAYDLTIYNAASSQLTLQVMLIIAAVFVPVVLAYQGWSYWVFRQRVTREAIGRH